MAGVYVHIPFCSSRCLYCGFYSTTQLSMRGRYIEAVIKEYALRGNYLCGEDIETIYIGGGTPSVLTQDELKSLFSALPIRNKNVSEVTIECNPDDITPEFVGCIKELGVNRVSMGVQSFSDFRLRFLRRRHTSKQAVEAVRMLRNGGINNISIDLMFGFPGQTIEEWSDDITKAVSLDVEHISAYSLTYEEGTPLSDMLKRGEIREIDEELSRDMYYLLIDTLASYGYEQYEISNFYRAGFRAKHNSNYWSDVAYIGLGAAAHSYDHHSRQWNVEDVDVYINNVEQGKLPFEREELSPDTLYNDMVTTSLRTCDGIDLSLSFHNKDYLITSAQPFIDQGWLAIDNQHLHLTRQGLYISDTILADLMKV